MVTPPKFWILDASNRLCILSDAFLIKVFPLCGVVFADFLVVGSHYWAWFWRSRATACHRRMTCDSPAMHASQGDPLVVFQGSFCWIGLLGWVQQELLYYYI